MKIAKDYNPNLSISILKRRRNSSQLLFHMISAKSFRKCDDNLHVLPIIYVTENIEENRLKITR